MKFTTNLDLIHESHQKLDFELLKNSVEESSKFAAELFGYEKISHSVFLDEVIDNSDEKYKVSLLAENVDLGGSKSVYKTQIMFSSDRASVQLTSFDGSYFDITATLNGVIHQVFSKEMIDMILSWLGEINIGLRRKIIAKSKVVSLSEYVAGKIDEVNNGG